MDNIEQFNAYRATMNERILQSDNKVLKRIFNLDTNAFTEGHVDKPTKELIGLACSLVMRCDDCVRYHLGACIDAGLSREEIIETMAIANLIGGTIVIPHLRKAFEYLDYFQEKNAQSSAEASNGQA